MENYQEKLELIKAIAPKLVHHDDLDSEENIEEKAQCIILMAEKLLKCNQRPVWVVWRGYKEDPSDFSIKGVFYNEEDAKKLHKEMAKHPDFITVTKLSMVE